MSVSTVGSIRLRIPFSCGSETSWSLRPFKASWTLLDCCVAVDGSDATEMSLSIMVPCFSRRKARVSNKNQQDDRDSNRRELTDAGRGEGNGGLGRGSSSKGNVENVNCGVWAYFHSNDYSDSHRSDSLFRGNCMWTYAKLFDSLLDVRLFTCLRLSHRPYHPVVSGI